VLSGAYAVLHGAPALVAAVDRYVIVDASRPAELVTEEVRAALGSEPAPYFDASALRTETRKLGLGSSAAILVATLASQHPEWLESEKGRALLMQAAFDAHHTAQGGGSGVDVVAAVHGGIQSITRSVRIPERRAVTLPVDLHIELWACPTSASTQVFLTRVARFGELEPMAHATAIGVLSAAARDALLAVETSDPERLLGAFHRQHEGLRSLGEHSGIPIITEGVARLHEKALEEGGIVLPAGAGGGDIAFFAGMKPPSKALQALRDAEAHETLRARLGAPGVHLERA
jgi:phosphomevalonate kinase